MKFHINTKIQSNNIKRINDFWVFIYHFIAEFNYNIEEVDIKSDEHERRFMLLLYGSNQARIAKIEFDGYEGIITYHVSVNDKMGEQLIFKRESEYIKKYNKS
jgi:hypothetical protein